MEIISQYEQAPELTNDGLAETVALSSLHSISHEVEHAYLEEDCRADDPESVALPKHELPDNLHTMLLDIIGSERMRIGIIIPRLFGVRRIHPETFASLRLALGQLIEHGKIIQDEKGFFKQRRLVQSSSNEQSDSGSQDSDLSLTQRIRAAGIGTGPQPRSHTVNHRTARKGVRRRY